LEVIPEMASKGVEIMRKIYYINCNENGNSNDNGNKKISFNNEFPQKLNLYS
jgi:hypothetical protein